MNVKTKTRGPGGSTLVFEQRIQDLCHDELFEQGTGTDVAYDLITDEASKMPAFPRLHKLERALQRDVRRVV